MRYYALVFKSGRVNEDLKRLFHKSVEQWTQDNVDFIVDIYKNSKPDIEIK